MNKNGLSTKAERLEFIAQSIQEEGFLSVDSLVENLNVSRMTVHRDLDELQSQGTLRKVRGGATVHRSTQFESSLEYRKRAAIAEKRQIAKAAAKLINSGDVLMIDDSTTSLALLPHLKDFDGLTVITNFTPVLAELEGDNSINLISVGGQYDHRHAAYFGLLSEMVLGQLYADILFASLSSMKDMELYHQDQRIVGVKRAMLESAERRVLLLDSSKIDQGALYRVCAVEEFTDVIFDSNADEAVISQIRERNINTIVA